MRKFFTFVTALMATIAMNATVVTLTPADFSAATSAATSASKDGVSASLTSGTIIADQIRIYKSQTITISCENAISAIVFTCIGQGDVQYGPGCFVAQEGYTYSDYKGTWLGSATSVAFKASNQVRATKIEVYLDGEVPGAVTYDTLNIAQAIETGMALDSAATSADAYVIEGYVVNSQQYLHPYGNQTWFMADDVANTGAQDFEAYACVVKEDGAVKQVIDGDKVALFGRLTKYWDRENNKFTVEIKNGVAAFIEKAEGSHELPTQQIDTISVAEAIELGMALAASGYETAETYVVKGFACATYAPNEGYSEQTWYMADEPTAYSEFQAYQCTPDYTVQQGDYMLVKGQIMKYIKNSKTTIEISRGTAVHGEGPSPREIVPSDAVLANYYEQGQVCVCIYVPSDMACYDIVLSGGYNGWSDNVANCVRFIPVVGYRGWYVTSFVPEDTPDSNRGISVKPIMLDGRGLFNWNYQASAVTIIRGDVYTMPGYANEIDFYNLGTDAPNVFSIDGWKHDPCAIVYQNYTISVINDGCGEKAVPYIIGGFNGWNFQQMSFDEAKTTENGAPTYSVSYKGEEGGTFQIASGLMDESGQIVEEASWNPEAYLLELVDGQWIRLMNDDGRDLVLQEDTNIVFDLRAGTLRWARCVPKEQIIVKAKVPFWSAADKTVEILGDFDNWAGTSMTYDAEDSCYFAIFEADSSQFCKFRLDGTWDYSLQKFDEENDMWVDIADNQFVFGQLWQDTILEGSPIKIITLDFSNPYMYRWSNDFSIVSVTCDNTQGRVTGSGRYDIWSHVTITAYPINGYHFVQWNDSVIENPRTITTTTRNMSFVAEFALNTYSFNAHCDTTQGNIDAANGEYEYNSTFTITATPKYGYRFTRWSDGNTQSTRTITITQDMDIEAYFAPNTYIVSAIDDTYGSISGTGSYLYQSICTVTAIPNNGCKFIQWSDGDTTNPRIFRITEDITFEAVFGLDTTDVCGKDYALAWAYNPSTKTLTISGTGAFDEHMECGMVAKQEMTTLVINEGVTSIGASAFANCSNLASIQLPASVKTIGAKAFENCLDLVSIYNYRERPCLVDATAFDGVNKFDCTLYVLAGSVAMYQSAGSNWKDFYFIVPIGSTAVNEPITEVETIPNDNNVVVTWPTSEDANSYTLVISKDGVVFCTLTFDANGQLLGIAFAPGRDGIYYMPAAEKTANGGLRFTVTGLDSGTEYQLTVTAKDINDQVVDTYASSFETKGKTDTPTDIKSTEVNKKSTKLLRNGQILILRGDKIYTTTGQEVR